MILSFMSGCEVSSGHVGCWMYHGWDVDKESHYAGPCSGLNRVSLNQLFQGNTEQHQLTLIAQLCGAINEEVCPNLFIFIMIQWQLHHRCGQASPDWICLRSLRSLVEASGGWRRGWNLMWRTSMLVTSLTSFCPWTLARGRNPHAYLIFVTNAANAVRVKFLAECKKFQKNEKITVLGSVYIAAVMYYFTLSV